MVDIDKHIKHWRRGALLDWRVANELIEIRRYAHGLFFAHLALEKLLKAHVCKQSGNIAPFIHNLVMLAQRANLGLSSQQVDTLASMNPFNLNGRYPPIEEPRLSKKQVQKILADAEEMMKWLKKQL